MFITIGVLLLLLLVFVKNSFTDFLYSTYSVSPFVLSLSSLLFLGLFICLHQCELLSMWMMGMTTMVWFYVYGIIPKIVITSCGLVWRLSKQLTHWHIAVLSYLSRSLSLAWNMQLELFCWVSLWTAIATQILRYCAVYFIRKSDRNSNHIYIFTEANALRPLPLFIYLNKSRREKSWNAFNSVFGMKIYYQFGFAYFRTVISHDFH